MNKVLSFCIVTIIAFTVVFFGCSDREINDNIKYIDKFPAIVGLQGSDIKKINNSFFALQMGLKNDILVFCDWEHSPHFHAYKVPDFTFLGSFGQQGRGPGELSNPVFWSQFTNTASEKI
jgi:hypothetical protein